MKTKFFEQSANDILKQYKNRSVLMKVEMVGLVLLAIGAMCLSFMEQISFAMTILVYILLVVLALVVRVGNFMWNAKLNGILIIDCNPQKYAEISWGIYTMSHEKSAAVMMQLNLANGYYFAGEFQKGCDIIQDISVEKKTSMLGIQYYNIYANCCNGLGQYDLLKEIRNEVAGIIKTQKQNSNLFLQAQHILNIIDGIIAIHNQEYELAKNIQENLLLIAKFPLQEAVASYRFGEVLEAQEKWDEAVEHYGVTIEKGGTIYFVEKAKERIATIQTKG